MSGKRSSGFLDDIARIYLAAEASDDGQRCMVAPSPEARERLAAGFAEIRENASAPLARLLRSRERERPGFNDGLIYPGRNFPLGTPVRAIRSAAGRRAPMQGDLRVLVVLVDFDDQQFDAANDAQRFDDLFFSQGVLPSGSVREYFADASNGLVNIVGEVVGPYRLSENLSYYTNGDSGTGTAPNARDMAEEAAQAANPDVDYSTYDNDADGYVDAFIVVHAGADAASTLDPDDIWSHKWVLPSEYSADGVKIYAYLTIDEFARAGVACHELGHLLFGFPDLYDTDNSSEGVGNWCLMGGGSWLGPGPGDVPCHPSAWCKADQGWVTVQVQTTNRTESVADVKDGRKIYRLWKNGASGSEYFLVENRQQVGFDEFLPGSGLLIWHIDDSIANNSNEVHPKVALEQADGVDDLGAGNNRGDDGDPYPGSASNTVFSSTSTPSSESYAGVDTCVRVSSISAPAQTMTAHLAVRCRGVIEKDLTKDRTDKSIKEVDKTKEIKELKEKDFKEIKEKEKKEYKEFKEFKELKEKEKKELKEFKEIKEKEKKEFKEKEIKEFKDGKEFKEGKEFEKPNDGWHDYGAEPFIDRSLRPDLERSALAGEEDADDLGSEIIGGSAASKREFDSKPREY